MVAWTFSVEGGLDIEFSVKFIPSASDSATKQEEVGMTHAMEPRYIVLPHRTSFDVSWTNRIAVPWLQYSAASRVPCVRVNEFICNYVD